MGFLQSFLEDYIWYHAITLAVVFCIALLVTIHHKGSQQNLSLAKQYKTIMDPILHNAFSQYDG